MGGRVVPSTRTCAVRTSRGRDEYVFEGYELDDALERANEVLEDDVSVSERDGRAVDVKPFLRKELLGPLERWFFGRS